jgi:hypothetical protein
MGAVVFVLEEGTLNVLEFITFSGSTEPCLSSRILAQRLLH